MTSTDQIQALAADFPPASREQWLKLVDKVLKGAAFERRLVSRTMDGLEIQPLYTRADAPALSHQSVPEVARAGGGGWLIASRHAETDPTALATAIREDVEGGADAITIVMQTAGQSGLPSDATALEAALADTPLDRVKISLQAGSQAIHCASVLSTIAKQRAAIACVSSLGIDPLGTLARTGELTTLRPDGSFAPGMPWLPAPATTLLVDARPVHEAGGSEAQELAAVLSTVVAYLRAAEAGGMAPGDALPRIGLALAVDADLFLGIAKLRAVRRLVWRVGEACGAGDAAGRMPLAVSTSERMLTRRDPWVNLLRATAACSAGAFGGADEITVLPHTWALGQPDAFARRMARNIGLVLREESALGRIADPAGGAFYVEKLTDDLAAKAWSLFQEWEAEGGMLAALRSGLVQDQIAAVAAARDEAIAKGRIALTGTSTFPMLADDGVAVAPWPPVPPLSPQPTVRSLLPHRLAAPFERLRDAADVGSPSPTIFLASLGTPAEYGARATWITNFLAAGGIRTLAGEDVTNSTDAGRAFADSGAKIACICGTDASYAEIGEATAMALKAAGAAKVYLAGQPREQKAALESAGVDGMIFAGIDAVATLQRLHQELGLARPA